MNTKPSLQSRLSPWLPAMIWLWFTTFLFLPKSNLVHTLWYLLLPFVGIAAWDSATAWRLARAPAGWAALAFFAWSGLGCFTGDWKMKDAFDQFKELLLTASFTFAAALMWLRSERADIRRGFLLAASLATLSCLFLCAWALWAILVQNLNYRSEGLGKLSSPIHLGALCGAFSLWAAYLLHWRGRFRTSLVWTLIAVPAFTLLLSFSRGPYLGFAAAILPILARHWKRALAVMGAAAVAGTLVISFPPSFLRKPIGQITRAGTIKARLDIWGQTWDQSRHGPLMGHGTSRKTPMLYTEAVKEKNILHSHNALLGVLYSNGFPGAALLLAVLGTAAWALRRQEGWAFILYGTLVSCTNDYTLITKPGVTWLYIWLPVALGWAASAGWTWPRDPLPAASQATQEPAP